MDGVDGVDYINVYSKGQTKIGRWLSNFQKINIKIDDLKVSSIEGYWYYLLTNKSYLLKLNGTSAKMAGMKERKINEVDNNFIEKIKYALDIKIKSDIISFSEILNYDIEIPLVHFYANKKDINKKYPGHNWIIEHLEKRRKQLYKKYHSNK